MRKVEHGRGRLAGDVFSGEGNGGDKGGVVAGDAMPVADGGGGDPVGKRVKWIVDGGFEG